jgi:hypothetical protein
MAIKRPHAETDIAAAFSRQLADFVRAPADDSRKSDVREAYAGAEPDAPTLADLVPPGDRILGHDAQQIFVLGLRDAANNAGVGALTPAGWRFFAGDQPGKMLLGRVSRRNCSAGWRMTAGYYGDRVWDVYQASNALDHLREAQARDYELRVLIVTGLNVEAFWLVDQGREPVDLMVPFPAMPNHPIEALNREPVYTMPNFLAAIRPVAQLRLLAESHCG